MHLVVVMYILYVVASNACPNSALPIDYFNMFMQACEEREH